MAAYIEKAVPEAYNKCIHSMTVVHHFISQKQQGEVGSMVVNTLGNVLLYYREKYQFQQDKVCHGICSVATYSKVENGRKVIDSLAAECLLGRIGKEVLQFEILLNDNDYSLWTARLEIQKQISEENDGKAKELLRDYREKMPAGESVHEQFCLYREAQIALKEQKSVEEVCERLYEALKLTKSEIDSEREKTILFNPTEIEILLLLLHYEYPVWKKKDHERELLELFHFVEEIYSGRQKEKTGTEILKELIELKQRNGDYRRVISYVDKAVAFISQGRGMDYLAELHFIKAKALEKLYHEKSEWKEKERDCKEECLMAYYVFDILKQQKEKQEVQQFCEEVLEWQITD